jgi:hypothetical protein
MNRVNECMPNISQIVIWETLGLLFALIGIVFVQLLTGQIHSRGLLMRKEGDRSFSPERVQLLLATLATGFHYLSQVLKDPTHLPEVPQSWLLLFGGSHALYIGLRLYLSRAVRPTDT